MKTWIKDANGNASQPRADRNASGARMSQLYIALAGFIGISVLAYCSLVVALYQPKRSHFDA